MQHFNEVDQCRQALQEETGIATGNEQQYSNKEVDRSIRTTEREREREL